MNAGKFDDPHRNLERLTASPSLLAAWRAKQAKQYAEAWRRLEYSGNESPAPPDGIVPHFRWVRLWDAADGWTTEEHHPTTLTALLDLDGTRCVLREATWRRDDHEASARQIAEFLRTGGTSRPDPPRITVQDAEVPVEPLTDHLLAIAACRLPAIPPPDPSAGSLTTDVGTFGFEAFTRHQPAASVRYQWADGTPPEWDELLGRIGELRAYLVGRFDGEGRTDH